MTDRETPNENISIKEALAISKKRLKDLSDSYQSDSRLILTHIINKPQSWIFAHSEEKITKEQYLHLNNILDKLESGIPLPYILGEWEFFNLRFNITPDTLIPRPETELLVETALSWLQDNPDKNKLAEIGTGSGCIPISIAMNNSNVQITSCDISQAALDIAQINSQTHQIQDRINFMLSDIFDNLNGKYHLICSNPPYIPTKTLRGLEVFEKEPTLALDGGAKGLDIIAKILSESADHLLPGGLILMEIEARQGIEVQYLAQQNFPSADIHVKKDLAGHDRLLVIQT